jgi:hypothetical protein
MKYEKHYLTGSSGDSVVAVVQGIDRDVERGEDMLTLGLCIVMLSSTFAPVAPPNVLLPLVALTFAVSVYFARKNYHGMERKLLASMAYLSTQEKALVHPIAAVFTELSVESLAESFNPVRNLKRTVKSALGGVLINPLWMPIFYVMGIQIREEKNLFQLNQAIMGVEKKIYPPTHFLS